MSEFSKLTFFEWMEREYGDNWPTSDADLNIWYSYLEYVKEEDRKCE
jgi:hypothetical protein